MTSSAESTTEVLAGLVERVTFHSQESGFCVLRVKARGHRDLVATVGHAAMISAGEWITASGVWINDRNHGLQFKAHFLKTHEPSTVEGIEKYLGSGMIRGIGPVYAKRLVKAFGKDVFDIIDAAPERLREVTGITGSGNRNRWAPTSWPVCSLVQSPVLWLEAGAATRENLLLMVRPAAWPRVHRPRTTPMSW
jgi:ATP-dependent exoDNAse (exonuclease V) alpha subunit